MFIIGFISGIVLSLISITIGFIFARSNTVNTVLNKVEHHIKPKGAIYEKPNKNQEEINNIINSDKDVNIG